jgi:hypothetical protein
MKNWTDSERDDLSHIPLAIEKGWTPEFEYHDKWAGRTTPLNVPHFPVSFKKDNKTAWKCFYNTNNSIVGYWRVADLNNNHYCKHRKYETIEKIFDKE